MPTQNTGDQMMISLQWNYSSAPVHTSHCKNFIIISTRKALKQKTRTRGKILQELLGLGRLAQTAGKHANPCQAEQGGIFKFALLLKQRIRQRGMKEEGGVQTGSKG